MKGTPYALMNEFLYKLGPNNILQRCLLEHECQDNVNEAHSGPVGGHF